MFRRSRRLVIHIGAQKCASSSLQASLELVAEAAKGRFSFCHLQPELLQGVNQALEDKHGEPFGYIDGVLSTQDAYQVVVSHEMMGNHPELVCAIAGRALEKHFFDYVVISGYSRLQSSYYISEFSQWGFRGRAKLYADMEAVLAHNLDWRKFTALERSLLAFSLDGNDRDWFADYQGFCRASELFGESVSVVSCHIPTRQHPYSLLNHFMSSCGLSFGLIDLESLDVRENLSFQPLLIHAISSHLCALRPWQQSFFPRPHAGNQWLFSIGKRMKRMAGAKNILLEFNKLFSCDFQRALIGHLDCRSSVSNKKYCDLMSVDFNYFQPSEDASLLSKSDLLSLARQTTQDRDFEDIEHLNRRIEDACMQSIQAEIECS